MRRSATGGGRAGMPRGVRAWSIPVLLAMVCGAVRGEEPVPQAAVEAIRKASADYVTAFNGRDYEALARQWTEKAELIEGGARVEGRERIVGSIRGWLDRHPQARLQIKVTDVEMLAAPLARVSGTMLFTRQQGEKPVESRFTSLRVLEEGGWRLAESLVAASHGAALDDFDWVLGNWQATDAVTGMAVEATYEKTLGGYAIVGRTKIRPKSGPTIDGLEVIHADRDTGFVRSWTFDSTGARAEGVFQTDGTTLNETLVGKPAASVAGRVARWERLLAPTGDGRFTLHAIERSIDGVPLPDGRPLHFRKIR